MTDSPRFIQPGREPRPAQADGLDQKRLAERLRTSRELVGLSQQAVTDLTGIPRSAVSDIERGERRVDSLELKRLALIYGVSIDYLLGDDPDRESFRPLARAHAGLTDTDREKLLAFAQFLQHSAAIERPR
jgi:transcriptional regulator with XRE-family HTH domain